MSTKRPAIFFDRDGTLIADHGYMSRPEQVELLPGAVDALRRVRAAGFQLVVISNQSGIGRGLVTEAETAAVWAEFERQLREQGIKLDGGYYCPHGPHDDCECRKPKPGMLLEAAAKLGIDFTRSYVVGDKLSDGETAEAVGARPVFLGRASQALKPGWIRIERIGDLPDALGLP